VLLPKVPQESVSGASGDWIEGKRGACLGAQSIDENRLSIGQRQTESRGTEGAHTSRNARALTYRAKKDERAGRRSKKGKVKKADTFFLTVVQAKECSENALLAN